MSPFFSVIIPSFNSAKTVTDAIDSVLNQTFLDFEILVVDDGSTDNTQSVISPYLINPKVKFYRKQNGGVSSARNLGAENAKGKFITFLDSDDTVSEKWLFDFFQHTEENTGLVFSGMRKNNEDIFPHRLGPLHQFVIGSIPHTYAINRSIFCDVGGFDEFIKQSENWELLIRVINKVKAKGLLVNHAQRISYFYNKDKSQAYSVDRCLKRGNAYAHFANKYESSLTSNQLGNFRLVAARNFIKARQGQLARKVLLTNLKRNVLVLKSIIWYSVSYFKTF